MISTDKQVIVKKGWGFEKWIVNNDRFCGKLLYFVSGKSCSWHFHLIKDEVFYIQSGELLVTYSWGDDLTTAKTVVLKPGDSFEVPKGLRHRMTALKETEMFEFSTFHDESDSIRLVRGD